MSENDVEERPVRVYPPLLYQVQMVRSSSVDFKSKWYVINEEKYNRILAIVEEQVEG